MLSIVSEAGGRLSSLCREPHIVGGSGISTNGYLHRHVLALLGWVGRQDNSISSRTVGQLRCPI